MPDTWINALAQYDYPVELSDYGNRHNFPNNFNRAIQGNRNSTIQFEDYFRDHCSDIESWFEVVYWKLYSQPRVSNKTTNQVIRRMLENPRVTTRELLSKLNTFMISESKEDFNSFRRLFKFGTTVIAIVATFPAFIDPQHFPMVDTRVAKWVNTQYRSVNEIDPEGPKLIPSAYQKTSSSTTLTMIDFAFYISWIHWARYMSQKLSCLTGARWRARDVEMAVFTAWGGRHEHHPKLKLNALPAIDEKRNKIYR
jgi:hypothetical protein